MPAIYNSLASRSCRL
ncbi:uncharacterized protein FPRN_15259 [Fusarium proliferatum]|nr:uncharacterized protein FPRN_15259 [Fusarium proliferatum]